MSHFQGILPFIYEAEKTQSGMTAFAGLPLYLDLAQALGLARAIDTHVGARTGSQGYTDSQVIHSLILLNLAGGESVDDINTLECDAGLNRLIRHVQWSKLTRKERRDMERRWRKGRTRVLPSASSIFRYLSLFHDPEQETLRDKARKDEEERAFIPAPTEALKGLYKVNGELLDFAQKHSPEKTATLDMDATLVETSKNTALRSYKGFTSYQPLNTYWAEHGLIVHSEFRDGNVPAGYQQRRVLEESLDSLPAGIEKVNLRSDTAAYQWDLLKYCAEGRNKRFGIIEFVVGCDVTPEFKKAVSQVAETNWHTLYRDVDGNMIKTNQEWAEVVFVPSAIGMSKKGPEYRFVAIREPLSEQLPLSGFESMKQLKLPFPTVNLFTGTDVRLFKLHGIVTNRLTMAAPALIQWYRSRCGKSEEVHSVMKSDLGGGRLPSGYFGANAAWWSIMIVSLNLYVLMNRLVLGGHWANKRMKAVRFGVICCAGRVVQKARRLRVRLESQGSHLALLLRAREKILSLA